METCFWTTLCWLRFLYKLTSWLAKHNILCGDLLVSSVLVCLCHDNISTIGLSLSWQTNQKMIHTFILSSCTCSIYTLLLLNWWWLFVISQKNDYFLCLTTYFFQLIYVKWFDKLNYLFNLISYSNSINVLIKCYFFARNCSVHNWVLLITYFILASFMFD
jgi:hypothetical protein